jgi:hypothetical protein
MSLVWDIVIVAINLFFGVLLLSSGTTVDLIIGGFNLFAAGLLTASSVWYHGVLSRR